MARRNEGGNDHLSQRKLLLALSLTVTILTSMVQIDILRKVGRVQFPAYYQSDEKLVAEIIGNHSKKLSNGSSNITETAAICVIAKAEERYIDEWIDYNLLVLGFDTIYIYDNSKNFTLQNYTADKAEAFLQTENPEAAPRRHVFVEHLPYNWMQRAAYKKCLHDHGNNHTWLALIDGDEFLVLKRHASIAHLLTEHCASGSLSINWYLFGTAQQTNYTPLPVLQRFQYREPRPTREHKVIVRAADYDWANPQQKRGVSSPHSVALIQNTTQHDTNGRETIGHSSYNGPTDVVVLHHYMYKSEEEWQYKWCVRANVAGIHKRCGETPLVGTVFDDSAWLALKSRVPWYG